MDKVSNELANYLDSLIVELRQQAATLKRIESIVKNLQDIHKEVAETKNIIETLGKINLNDPLFKRKNELVRKLIDNENIQRKYGWMQNN